MAFLKMPRPIPVANEFEVVDDSWTPPTTPRYISFSLDQFFEVMFRVRKWELSTTSSVSAFASATNGVDSVSKTFALPNILQPDPASGSDTSDDEEDWMAVRLQRAYVEDALSADGDSYTDGIIDLGVGLGYECDVQIAFGYQEGGIDREFYYKPSEGDDGTVYMPVLLFVGIDAQAESAIADAVSGEYYHYTRHVFAGSVAFGAAHDYTLEFTILGNTFEIPMLIGTNTSDTDGSNDPPLDGSWALDATISNLETLAVDLTPVEWYAHDDGEGAVWDTSDGTLLREEIYAIRDGTLS